MNRDRVAGMGVSVGIVLGAVVLPAGAAGGDDGWSGVVLPAARQVDLKARHSGHPYGIFVAEPSSPAPAEGHPVIYVLDGNAAFPVAAFLARSAASRREVTGHVPPLVVGIGYPGKADFDVAARRRDYTPGGMGAGGADGGGGADAFLDFLEGELKPLIEARYAIDRKRQALFGHSFGGLGPVRRRDHHSQERCRNAGTAMDDHGGCVDMVALPGRGVACHGRSGDRVGPGDDR